MNQNNNTKLDKEFSLSSWAIDNKMTVFVVIVIILTAGIMSYFNMPRESFPEIIENKIYVSTIYPGNSSEDVEKLVTKRLEDEIRDISGITKVTSNSMQDYSMILVELTEDMTVDEAKDKVKDKVDLTKAKSEWPTLDTGAKVDPNVFDLNLSEAVPILNVNISGNFTKEQLKDYAEYLEDKIEEIPEVKQVDIRGTNDKEVEVAVDLYKMSASKVSFNDILNAIGNENKTVSGGNITNQGMRTNLKIIGDIDNPQELQDIVVKTQGGKVLLRDIATINYQEEEATTFARYYEEPVVMLDIKKKSGKNMIDAVEQTKKIVKEAQENVFPQDLHISLSNDTSIKTQNQVDDLVNNIVFGVLLVVGVLMFFLGVKNALFVGAAIPLSMLMALALLSAYGVTMNTMVLFGLVMGLGMLVDNGIVVVENIHTKMEEGMSRIDAAKQGVGEIAWPIIASTATTLAAFFPLGLWPGTMGKFMLYFPLTLSFVLGSSLFVALVINAMLSSQYMTLTDKGIAKKKKLKKQTLIFGGIGIVAIVLGLVFKVKFFVAVGNLLLYYLLFIWAYKLFLKKASDWFMGDIFPKIENKYKEFLTYAVTNRREKYFFWATVSLLILSIMLFAISQPKVLFFPDNEANQAIVYIEYPEGTAIEKTNETTKYIEKKVLNVVNRYQYEKEGKPYNYMVESFIAQVGDGAGNPETDGGSQAEMPQKGKVTVLFREFKYRYDKDGNYKSTNDILEEIRTELKDVSGPTITVEKERVGPPRGYPISIEVAGEDYDLMLKEANKIKGFIEESNIAGIEKLQLDVNKNRPEVILDVDRQIAGSLNLNTQLIGGTLRGSIYGMEASTYKDGEDEYKIMVRGRKDQRDNPDVLINQPITFRNQASGQLVQIPISAVATVKNSSTYNVIKRKNYKRVITIYSNVLEGYNASEITEKIKTTLDAYNLPSDISYTFSGEQEEQGKNMDFLVKALLFAVFGITLIIVLQFNSVSKPIIIISAVVLSFIGVFLGLVIFSMDFVVIMTMMGIISLAGIVVNNAIVLVDYTQLLLDRTAKKLGIESEKLPFSEYQKATIDAGKSRLRPVLLTAITTVLGLVPLAIGLNIDFYSLITEFNPHIYVGGDNVRFWGPLAWTVIFGLSFATFLTLVIVPVMFIMISRFKTRKNPELI
ncbi:MAG: efflux RND transporter permease subunit [Flavobacteriales bacterium]|nr:efflux RND transporter permease subunit [Flavobacteriales bacterium]